MDVSIIIPAYNVEPYIAAAIESVLTQRFSGEYEMVIVDDASTDSTPRILASYQQRYPDRIRSSVREANMGANRNRYDFSLSAEGRYLAFLDADDIWLAKDKLQRQYDFLESHPEVGAVCSNARLIDQQGRGEKRSEGAEGLVPFEEMILGHADIYCSSLMCRKDVYERMAEDSGWYIANGCFNDTLWAFWLSYHHLLYRMEDSLSAYRVLENSACHSTDAGKMASLAKRYFKQKVCFLFTHEYPLEEKLDILSREYDKLFSEASFAGEMKVRNTKTFKMGKRMKEWMGIGHLNKGK